MIDLAYNHPRPSTSRLFACVVTELQQYRLTIQLRVWTYRYIGSDEKVTTHWFFIFYSLGLALCINYHMTTSTSLDSRLPLSLGSRLYQYQQISYSGHMGIFELD